MIYPENALEKLGFDEIRQCIKDHCLSDMGRELAGKMQAMSSFEQVNKFLRQTAEFRTILLSDQPIQIQTFFDLRSLADKIRLEGAFLTEEEFHKISLSLQTVFSVIGYFTEREEVYPNLVALFEHLPVEHGILKKIEQVIDPKGKIRVNASAELQHLNGAIAKAESESRKKIEQVYKHARDSGWTADGSLTVRDGRLCIPVLAENKRRIKGFIHDESASGQTVFIEPEEVFHLNNQLRDLEFERRREIVRLLTLLTTELRPYVPLLHSYHGLLTKLDFVRAKALFALDIEAEMPVLMNQPSTELTNARHPLLFLNFKKEKQTVVPLNIRIDEGQRIVIVSGPNAGGKSVAMKTVGLLQVMVQCGLLIPADEHSKVGIYKQIFADIGDDQSIESDLSTYSAHLTKMKYFAEHANGKTLFLIDEFGTGTDPQFGGPIAEAVLETINQRRAKGIVTTHYSNLKVYANATEGIENASMMFDNIRMQPLYILETGKPGSSYAFEIAQKIGLPQQVLHAARNKIGVQQKKVDTLLIDLERDKKTLHEQKVEAEKRDRRLKQLTEENEKQKAWLEENRKEIIKKARLEAQEIIRNANKTVENTIAGIKRSKADKEQTQKLRAGLETELKKNQVIEKKPQVNPETAELLAGDWVKLVETGTQAQVIDVAKGNVVLAIGELRSVVKRDRLVKIRAAEVPKQVRRSGSDLTQTIANFSPEIDVRGLRGEDALFEIEKHLDKALMIGLNSLKIIHGKGDGILRKLIREYLRKFSQVSRMEDEHADRGGDGITYVYFS